MDKASQILTVDLAALLAGESGGSAGEPTYTITATKYSLSGSNCETVSEIGTDLSANTDTQTPAGGKGVENCAFLIHL